MDDNLKYNVLVGGDSTGSIDFPIRAAVYVDTVIGSA